LKGTSGHLFFAVVRFSPPSQEDEAAKRKAQVKNNSPDPQELTCNAALAADERGARRQLAMENHGQNS
jgi:hypothetical protein